MNPRTTSTVVAIDGRIAGPRALATRQRLVDALAPLLDSRSFREIKVVDIARAAGTSPAAFYQYFASLEDALEVLAIHVAQQGRVLDDVFTAAAEDGTLAGAREAVDHLFDFWRTHKAALGAIDAMAAEGDERFVQARNHLLSAVAQPLVDAVARRTDAAPAAHPRALAGSLATLLASAATHEGGLSAWGSRDELRESLACLVISAFRPSR
ncbi:TetR/AcrR family transcriptional regulator [Streptomyces sp. NBC_01433]|uniref:TetR family transcriptional regulator n=1 Tax=Streptomyces sp. NBC_01433 TaxID=2903864 RepID=UPI002253F628|nr:TetR family transcriptional regulator [Streptomyces sp. NBC_01433]MCX4682072.1 TetR/AcrR family transcriptional regulator [Streptomyces sp. NBC_01433]